MKTWDYLFEFIAGENEGECIFVECEGGILEANKVIFENGFTGQTAYRGRYTPEEAEILGYDTY